MHEDDDILGMISPEAYTHFTPGWGAVLMGCFVASVGVLAAVVSRTYPDKVRCALHAHRMTLNSLLTL